MMVKALRYDIIDASLSGYKGHPQAEMEKLGIGDYYYGVPETLFDCWLFLYEEWPDVELPCFIKRVELDSDKMPELKMVSC